MTHANPLVVHYISLARDQGVSSRITQPLIPGTRAWHHGILRARFVFVWLVPRGCVCPKGAQRRVASEIGIQSIV